MSREAVKNDEEQENVYFITSYPNESDSKYLCT